MTHCITDPSTPISIARGAARVHMVPAASDNISWLIEYTPGSVALVDGPSLRPVLEYCAAQQLTVTHVINTHTHGDHIGVNHGLKRNWGDLSCALSDQLEVWGGARVAEEIPHLTRPLSEGDRCTLGPLQGVVWLTEGHLDGHISLFFWADTEDDRPAEGDQAALFCGDTLFAAGCGRLFDGPAEKMHQSLQRLCALPSDTLVFPAHEYTQDNLRFACHIAPNDEAIVERLREVDEVRAQGRSTLPSDVALERSTNLFFRAPSVERFAELRALKDRGVHRA